MNKKYSVRRVAVLGCLLATVALPSAFAQATETSPPITGAAVEAGSMYRVVDQINARSLWAQGFDGSGVNVAVIDTGVAPVPELAHKTVAVVDLSAEARVPEARFVDTYGHGTHMAGIIAGTAPGITTAQAGNNPAWFMGVAPGAGIVSVKVADNSGAVDVSQVIAAVDWVTDNARDLNIRVINLSYSSGANLPYTIDPLAFAVERAWRAGIVVVAAAGNDGRSEKRLSAPATDPYVIAVAAAEPRNDGKFKVPSWATSGDGVRNPDLSAPGASIHSLRAPSSRIDLMHPEGYVSEQLFKGSGSSQAAAVVSGAVALLLDARPELTPDQVKALLVASADSRALNTSNPRFSGAGLLDVAAAAQRPTPNAVQSWTPSNGSAPLDQARVDEMVNALGAPIVGNTTVLGTPWEGTRWSGTRWSGGTWEGTRWSGGTWMGTRWSDSTWTGTRWSNTSWTGTRWSGTRWSNTSWTGTRWSGTRWSDSSWTGTRWSDGGWF
jgi:serine protease AprX